MRCDPGRLWAALLLTTTLACSAPPDRVPTSTPALVGAWRPTLRFESGALAGIENLEFMYVFNAGGTMTDTFIVDRAGEFVVGKAQTTPADESAGFMASARDALASRIEQDAALRRSSNLERLEEMAVAQGSFLKLGLLLQPVGFLVFFASAFAETKRAPFDLPEGESEIVGYFVEYSGMQFGLMFLSEFVEIVVLSGVITAVFLGAGHYWVGEAAVAAQVGPLWAAAIGAGVFLAKMIVLMWLQLTIRWLLPRFRYDQIQKLCWKILLPVALVNVFVTAVAVLVDPSLTLLAAIGVAELVAIGAVTVAAGSASAAETAHGHGDAHGDAAHAAAGH